MLLGHSVYGFIDDHCFATCRPCGPKETMEQWMAAKLVQEAFYNGWKSIHGLKWQTFDLPNGMTADMWGPRSLRRSDLRLLQWSRLEERMQDCLSDSELLYLIYGDSIFPQLQHIRSCHKGDNLTDRQLLENRVLKKFRICIEWHYGHLAMAHSLTISGIKNYWKIHANCYTSRLHCCATATAHCMATKRQVTSNASLQHWRVLCKY
jgi:hypothetical protein